MTDIQQTAAQNELDKLRKENPIRKMIICGVASVIFALGLLIAGIFIGFLFFAVVAVISFVQMGRYKSRMTELENIANGKQLIRLCPKCKSPNIQMSMVETGTITQQGTTTVGQNINPFKPFTHTNIKAGNTTTKNQFGNKCHCLDCGYVFDKPETMFQ